jgi:SAM-dependent methyltransferase/uncharacterized protein YbaR (Trm112 family)
MPTQIKISGTVQDLLRCPICHAKLKPMGPQFACTNSDCAAHFPVVNGIPVLINDQSSIFSIDEFVLLPDTDLNDPPESKLKETIHRFLPTISKNINGDDNYRRFVELLLRQSTAPRVLVVGGSIMGQGMEALANHPAIDLVESDVMFGPRTALICDGHDLPFDDGAFDGVVIQAVLEHVVDPYRCMEEIHRVLDGSGVVYAETPFMQQVHAAPFDFTRFTHLGHRRLFRRFTEIDSGVVCGPGMALAWSYQYFLMSFARSKTSQSFIRIFSRLTSFFLKYFDPYLVDKPGALDAASGYYFIGRKSDQVLSDRELITLYRGAQPDNN